MTDAILRLFDVAERLANLAAAELKAVLAGSGLQPVHARMLLYLAAANRYSNTPQAVGEFLGLTKGTVSQSLILLEARGLLARTVDAADRRVVRLALTMEGERLCAALRGALGRHFGPAAPPAAASLAEDLTNLLRVLQRAAGQRSFGVCCSCRHHLRAARGWRCGLTGEALSKVEGAQICRDHAPAGRTA